MLGTEEQVVQETEEVSPVPEAEKTEEVSETAVSEAPKPQYYTPEEIEDVLANDGDLDAKRLSPEGRLLQRSFQRGLNPKLEERAAYKRRLDELEERVNATPQPPATTIEEAYQRDPRGTLGYIDAEIRKHRARLDDDPIGAMKEIENLRDVKDHLRDQEMFSTKQQLHAKDVASEVEAEIFSEIPDFKKKQDNLTDYALNKLGFTMEEIVHQSDPTIVGKSAKKFIAMVNKLYEMENATKTVQKKEVKIVPKTETAGRGDVDSANSQYAAEFRKAQNSGDWTTVLKMKGTLDKISPH